MTRTRHFRTRSFLLFALCCASSAALASEEQVRVQPEGWSVGVGAIVSDRGYVGEDRRVVPIPFVSYEGERFFIRGPGVGMRLVDRDAFDLELVARARFDGFDAEDLDIAGLEDRDDGVDLGLVATFSGDFGEWEASAVGDVAGASDGQELKLKYGYPIRGKRIVITPNVSLRWWSENLADYYFGTRDAEVARGLPAYAPGDALVPEIGVSAVAPLSRQWVAFGQAGYQRWPDAIRDSPLIERSGGSSVILGIAYRF
jgi:outer membrane protein